ncbi:MAG TPA: hypothetical protein DHW22_08320, partial [Planctomycetaceae bacterium]|nr:hypothetical protein [Planctomycetaceae bacterium]
MKLYFSQHFHLFLLLSLGIGTNVSAAQDIERGVSRRLASQRKATLSEIEYDVSLELQKTKPIRASIEVRFHLDNTASPLVLDFNAPEANIQQIQLNQTAIQPEIKNGHIIIPQAQLQSGKQALYIDFIAGNLSLNRNEEFLYTLLVPDRASTVFPCFDQPDLKAKFRLQLDLPTGWVASANGALLAKETIGKRTRVQYQQTKPISTYLFAFAAGNFQTVTRKLGGRTMTMYHRETDQEKVERNLNDIFMIHTLALDWMEDYTKIDYPFEKFDFVLIPSFQYGGMEHIGNIFYKADKLLLEKSATLDQKLSRASLIAHETSHMWFGNLVTMEWFDDVWLKEVFANFVAAKIVNPTFTEINHDLSFMVRHYPSAYAVDRTGGAHAIRQRLPNLNEAGTLYGNIIYNKAPIMMWHLENMIGPSNFQSGIREYLSAYSFSNATWEDLVSILDKTTGDDLEEWSQVWVNTPGRPHFSVSQISGGSEIRQEDPLRQDRIWKQKFTNASKVNGSWFSETVNSDGEAHIFQADNDSFLLNADGFGYGLFPIQIGLFDDWETLDRVKRGSLLISAYENVLEGEAVGVADYGLKLISIMRKESNELLLDLVLDQFKVIYWSFLTDPDRAAMADELESLLWDKMLSSGEDSSKKIFFEAFRDFSSSALSADRLLSIWLGELSIEGLNLSERDYVSLATSLAIRLPQRSEEIVTAQLGRIMNADRRRRFEWISPALSADRKVRDEFFYALRDTENRETESWVLTALQALHHPLRRDVSEVYILPSLELLEEIQSTGDIFFPGRWLTTTLSNHVSLTASDTVRNFLAQHPDYNEPLRLK